MVFALSVRTGISPKAFTLSSSELVEAIYIILPTLMLPDGDTTLLCAIDATTSSGVRLKLRSFTGSILATTVLMLEQIGAGADRPGTVANSGLILVAARSLISSSLRTTQQNTNKPTKNEEASK